MIFGRFFEKSGKKVLQFMKKCAIIKEVKQVVWSTTTANSDSEEMELLNLI